MAGMDYWRKYFKTSNGDIFETIEKAIMVAASDYSKEFRIRRDGIAQTLFSCKLIKCSGCDKLELGLPANDDDEEDDHHGHHKVGNNNYGVAEALTDEIEEETQLFGEVIRIKEIVDNSQDESESVLFNSLRKLQLMNLSMEILKATEIGKSVNVLRKHPSKAVRDIAKTLIEAWKEMVDGWVVSTEKTAVVSEATPESLNPSVLDEEEGLPSPPLDDLAFFYPQISLQLSEFFDGMDDHGNPGNSRAFNRNPKSDGRNEKKPSNVANMDGKKQEGLAKMKKNQPTPTKPSDAEPARRHQSKERGQDKFEETKRKLHERYQQAENAKKQRTIQVMELHDLPKQKQQNVRPGSNHNRHR